MAALVRRKNTLAIMMAEFRADGANPGAMGLWWVQRVLWRERAGHWQLDMRYVF